PVPRPRAAPTRRRTAMASVSSVSSLTVITPNRAPHRRRVRNVARQQLERHHFGLTAGTRIFLASQICNMDGFGALRYLPLRTPHRCSMRRRTPSNSLAVAALTLIAFLVAEAISLVHPLDIDEHSNGEAFAVCISVAGLGAGAPSRTPPPETPRVAVQGNFSIVLSVDPHRVDRPATVGHPHFPGSPTMSPRAPRPALVGAPEARRVTLFGIREGSRANEELGPSGGDGARVGGAVAARSTACRRGGARRRDAARSVADRRRAIDHGARRRSAQAAPPPDARRNPRERARRELDILRKRRIAAGDPRPRRRARQGHGGRHRRARRVE